MLGLCDSICFEAGFDVFFLGGGGSELNSLVSIDGLIMFVSCMARYGRKFLGISESVRLLFLVWIFLNPK